VTRATTNDARATGKAMGRERENHPTIRKEETEEARRFGGDIIGASTQGWRWPRSHALPLLGFFTGS
jgi:hypothetical protein